MLQKEKENLELKLQRLKEDAKEDFFEAHHIFLEEYEKVFEWLFSGVNSWIKSRTRAYFQIIYVDKKSSWVQLNTSDIFQNSLEKALSDLPLSPQKKQILQDLIFHLQISYKAQTELYHTSHELHRDPYFPLIEDMAIDGDITEEEFFALKHAYPVSWGNIKKASEKLPLRTRKIIFRAIDAYESLDPTKSESLFREEYSSEIQFLEKKWGEISHTLSFIARSYYKNPGKYKKYEHPQRRLKRTFKLALLRLLRKKLGNIDADNILERFEQWETFFEFFDIMREILDILSENPQSYEIYTISNTLEEAKNIVSEAELTREKILSWEKLTTSVSQLISQTESELDSGILSKILEDDTDFVGTDIYFRSEKSAWILSEWQKTQLSDEEDDEDRWVEEKYWKLSPRWAYEAIKEDFIELEKEKTKAFLEGRYDDIDTYNEKLFVMQRKLEKLWVILWEEL